MDKRWFGLAAISAGVAMIVVDATVVGVALPTIIRDLDLSADTAEWVNSAYALMFAALVITFGHTGDRWGRRNLFVVGVTIFALGSLFAMFAPNGGLLVLARIVEGIGGAMVLPAALSTMNALFRSRRDRAIAFSVWGAVIGGFAALGPFVGGLLTTDTSWRWIFIINLPIAVIVLALTFGFMPNTSSDSEPGKFDVAGAFLSAFGLASVVFAIIEGLRFGWLIQTRVADFGLFEWPEGVFGVVPTAFVLAIALLVGFYVLELHRSSHDKLPLIDFGLFRLASFKYANTAAVFVGIGEYGLIFVLPLAMQNMLGWSALGTGVVLLALAAGAFLGPLFGEVSHKVGARPVVIAGLAIECVAMVILGLVMSPDTAGWQIAVLLFFYGMGVGAATGQLSNITLVDVPVDESGAASGVRTTARQLGASLGIAILGAVLVATTFGATSGRLEEAGVDTATSNEISHEVADELGAGLPALVSRSDADVAGALSQGFASATRTTFLVAGGFLLLGLLAGLALPKKPLETNAVE